MERDFKVLIMMESREVQIDFIQQQQQTIASPPNRNEIEWKRKDRRHDHMTHSPDIDMASKSLELRSTFVGNPWPTLLLTLTEMCHEVYT